MVPETRPLNATGAGGLRRAAVEVFLASFLVLFQELVLIRWVGARVQAVGYFPNLILMAAFLGIGLGCLRVGRRSLAAWWAPALLVLTAATLALGRIAFTDEGTGDHLWLLYYDLPAGAPVVNGVAAPLLLLFVLTTASFVPLGQYVGERLRMFERAGRPLSGYAWDLGGATLGAAVFSAFSFLGLFPVVWMSVLSCVGAALLCRGGRAAASVAAGALIAATALVGKTEKAEVYSPYYALSTRPLGDAGVSILANGALHQVAVDMDRRARPNDEIRKEYDAPYQLLPRPPRRVLAIGAGSGNDVALALRQGAERVDAVEIDPRIARLGAERHPNAPYADPRVRVHVADARSFLNGTRERYDLIVFGTLDSMTRLSALSNVRLDNFVYTRESLQAARRCLTPDGGVILYFMAGKSYIRQRLTGLLTEVFGQLPLAKTGSRHLFNVVYAAGPAFDHVDGDQRRAMAKDVLEEARSQALPTDDWPFLYLEKKSLNPFYVGIMAAILAFSIAGVAVFGGGLRAAAADWPMFFMGAGFLLLETRAVTVMGLAWGNTWLTSAVVFSSILLMTLAGVLACGRRPPRWETGLGGVLLCLALVYAVPASRLALSGAAAKTWMSLFYVGGPVFFASLAFSSLYAARRDASSAFGWNLLGAMVGGLAEFLSMALGFKGLVLVAALFYLSAALAEVRRRAPARG